MSSFLTFVEYIGIIAFAISGALEGIKQRYDYLGVIIIGVVTSTGGGVIRDLILGINPPYSLRSGSYIYLAIIVATIVFIVNLLDDNVNRWTVNKLFDEALVLTDAMGLSVFVITGMQVAYNISNSYSAILYIFVGTISGVGGGIIRDMLIGNTPYIFDGHIYASAAIIGSTAYHLLTDYTAFPVRLIMIFCIILIFVVRMVSYHFNLNLPKATKIIK